MKYLIIYSRFHLKCLLKNKLFYVFIIYAYIYKAFHNNFLLRKTGEIWVHRDTPLEYKFIDQQYMVCQWLIICVSFIIYENFFKIYSNIFSIYIRKTSKFFHSMVSVLILANVIPCLLGEFAFLIVNYLKTKYWAFHWETTLIVNIEIIILIFFGISLYIFFHKAVLAIGLYFVTIFLTTSNNNIYTAIPLFASVMRGHFNPYSAQLWLGRIFLLCIAIVMYTISVKKFIWERTR